MFASATTREIQITADGRIHTAGDSNGLMTREILANIYSDSDINDYGEPESWLDIDDISDEMVKAMWDISCGGNDEEEQAIEADVSDDRDRDIYDDMAEMYNVEYTIPPRNYRELSLGHEGVLEVFHILRISPEIVRFNALEADRRFDASLQKHDMLADLFDKQMLLERLPREWYTDGPRCPHRNYRGRQWARHL